MDNNELNAISESIKEKIGEESFAKISDDMGTLITGNTLNLDAIKSKEEEITQLKQSNQQLITANGNLLKKVPMGTETKRSDEDDEDDKPKRFNYMSSFDKSGRFIN